MWPSFHTEKPVEMPHVTEGDLTVAGIAFGFTVGFGWFVVYHAIQQTRRARRWSTFIIMCWLEIIVCAIFALIGILYIRGVIRYSFWCYFVIVTCWALQVQLLLQIIVNRVCVLLHQPRSRIKLKLAVAVWITVINVTVYCIWIPAKLQISQQFRDVNVWWDRTEKCLYLLTDAVLNSMFITIARRRLVNLKKYDKLVKFNQYIIFVSLAMDVLIIAMMSYRNDFVYLLWHPLGYIVKLEIEMTMSKLIIKVAQSTGVQVYDGEEMTKSGPSNLSSRSISRRKISMPVEVKVATHVVTKRDLEADAYEMREVEVWQAPNHEIISEHQSQSQSPTVGMFPFPAETPSHI